jgi:MFS family permease
VILGAACVAGFVLAWAAGARPQLLLEVRLRWAGLVVAALALQLVLFAVHLHPPRPLTVSELHLVSYALLAGFAARNARIPGFLLAIGGLASNALVIFLNGGHMPVSHSASIESGGAAAALRGVHDNVTAAGVSTHLAFLGDVFAVPHGFPLANTFSIGDVMLVAGATLFVYTNGRASTDRAAVRALEPLRVPAFRALLGARMVSRLGDWISTAALVTWMYTHSHSTYAVSGVLLARVTASIAGSVVGGAVLGRRTRFAVLASVEAVRGLATLAAVGAIAAGQPAAVVACVFVSWFLAAATDPTASSLVAEALPADRRHAGNSLHALGRAIVMAIGAAGGGVLAARLGAVPALLADSGTFAVALVLYLAGSRRAPRTATPAAGTETAPTGRLDAFAIVCRRRRLAALVGSFAVATFAMGVLNASLPSFFAVRAPHVGGYGVAIGAIAAGLVCGEYLSGRAAGRIVDRIPALGFAIAAAVVATASASHSAATILLLLFALGVGDGTTETAYDTVVQESAPQAALDRVFAVAGALQQSAMILGFLAAPLLHRGAAFRVSAVALALAAGVGALVVARGHREPATPAAAPDAA